MTTTDNRSCLKLQLVALTFLLACILPRAQAQQSRFIYSGEPFSDADWGRSYKTSAQDRAVLARVDSVLKTAMKELLESPGDYQVNVDDMSYTFDLEQQRAAKARGHKQPLTGRALPLQGSVHHGDHGGFRNSSAKSAAR